MQSRCFVAIPIPLSIQELLKDWMDHHRSVYSFHKWVHPQDLHITLQFLGACTIQQIEQVKLALDQVVREESSFIMGLDHLGTFGSPKQPRILWMGVEGNLDRLHQIQQKVMTTLAPLGFPAEDRPYRPHITLAKKYQGKSFSLSPNAVPWTKPAATCSWKVDHLVLFKSHLGQLPMYEPVHSFTFYEVD
ncbi:RNA 2',3'-cyclic phosphodiesterase [Hazenella coriacea]|uniref:RNA 2',3'-cyclic phosphodiesterase n=1 Tax=Hazenella coriacea TaxID=1179467 RepID=A0A4R3LES2_9BACL|nr:RNA 2',3'-cyclic phosphodiesterase [Hazenella coriacea]TCS95956.1 2'-5' RNA ligase [Hazenella coriacea]